MSLEPSGPRQFPPQGQPQPQPRLIHGGPATLVNKAFQDGAASPSVSAVGQAEADKNPDVIPHFTATGKNVNIIEELHNGKKMTPTCRISE